MDDHTWYGQMMIGINSQISQVDNDLRLENHLFVNELKHLAFTNSRYENDLLVN